MARPLQTTRSNPLALAVVILFLACASLLSLSGVAPALSHYQSRYRDDASAANASVAAASRPRLRDGNALNLNATMGAYLAARTDFAVLNATVLAPEMGMCPQTLEIGWRPPGDAVVPRYIGNKCEPWWTREAVFFIGRLARPEWRAVEWGGGSSTTWLSRHVGSVITIEDDAGWVSDLGGILSRHNITNVDVRHRARRDNGTLRSKSRGCCYDDYIYGASDLPNASVDLVSVDGRAREHCLREAVRLVRPGGVVVLDNSRRKRYFASIDVNIPKRWLRHDAFLLHNVSDKQLYWINRGEYSTSFWIAQERTVT